MSEVEISHLGDISGWLQEIYDVLETSAAEKHPEKRKRYDRSKRLNKLLRRRLKNTELV